MTIQSQTDRARARDERVDATIRLNDYIRQLARRGKSLEDICAEVDRGAAYVRRIAGGLLL